MTARPAGETNPATLATRLAIGTTGRSSRAAPTHADPTPRASDTPHAATRGDLTRAPTQARQQVRRLAGELEAVFVNQLFQAMRASVPENGLIPQQPGQQMFTSLMDERLANEAAQRIRSTLGENLYRQLARRLPEAEVGAQETSGTLPLRGDDHALALRRPNPEPHEDVTR